MSEFAMVDTQERKMVYVLMYHELDGSINMYGFHLGTDLNEAKKIVEEKYEWRVANSQPLKFAELTWDHDPRWRYDGEWQSASSERKSPGFNRMKDRLGEDAAEKLRLDTVRRQEEAMAAVRSPVKPRRKAGPAHLNKIINGTALVRTTDGKILATLSSEWKKEK